MKTLLVFLVMCFFLSGCASMRTGKDGNLIVEYQGTASGAVLIMGEQNRRLQTAQAGEAAKAAIEKKMPVSLGQDAGRSDLQAGWMMNGYGAYGLYGQNPYGVSPAILAAEAASLGYAGNLPRLGEAIFNVQLGQQQATQTTDGLTVCPSGRPPNTDAEVSACNALNLKGIRKKVYGK